VWNCLYKNPSIAVKLVFFLSEYTNVGWGFSPNSTGEVRRFSSFQRGRFAPCGRKECRGEGLAEGEERLGPREGQRGKGGRRWSRGKKGK